MFFFVFVFTSCSPFSFSHRDIEPLPPMTMESILPVGADAADGQPGKRKYTKSEHYKQRRRHDRFNGMTEEEVRSRTLPDHLASNLDVVIVSRHFYIFLISFQLGFI